MRRGPDYLRGLTEIGTPFEEVQAARAMREADEMRPQRDQWEMFRQCRVLLSKLRPWLRLSPEAFQQALESAEQHPAKALACYQAIVRSLVPR